MMKYISMIAVLAMFMISGCQHNFLKPRQKPVQVVYRFDDHRWLELKGYNCEGELWFVDQKRGIRSQLWFQFYKIFTKQYINASERYIAVPSWDMTGVMSVSKDYGRTWQTSSIKGEEDDGSDSPTYDNIQSLTVVNDQGFLLTKQGRIYMSSLPFDDPRLQPGGTGVDYVVEFRGRKIAHHIDAIRPAEGLDTSLWGRDYIDPRILHRSVKQYYTNFQNLPDRVPEVKNYQGWTHMKCDLNAGL
ncbi:hypothetical protein Q3404_09720 [Pantoea phytobeneficialis]|uniref:Tli3-like domain-containing protein n=3 Tax=Pantoea phytobeneficialis TaxID=2052056 RepID=A0ABT8XTR8_9GAMM|nr:hypothetical protein [Pantoea phytobeneficialis]MDO6406856.1 hypothetical protein [Pantoea phytobeneficialis]